MLSSYDPRRDADGAPIPLSCRVEQVEVVDGAVVRRVHVTLDATTRTATILTQGKALAVAEAILLAAGK